MASDEYEVYLKTTENVTVDDIREELEYYYGATPGEREFYIETVQNAYHKIGSVYFSLEGTPPKGHAIYLHGISKRVMFYTVTGRPFQRWDNVELDVDSIIQADG